MTTRQERIKALERERLITDSIQSVFLNRNTTRDERVEVAQRWLAGDFSYYVYFAEARGIEPITLIAAALIEVQQDRLAPDGQPFGGKFTYMLAQIIQTEIQALIEFGFDDGNPTVAPFQSYPIFACNPVDNWLKTVDKSVYNSVENFDETVDKLAGVFE